ncbi:MAG: tRNA (adenosine(37)-N6)-threonylcarbamoyltransferase complex transferase subunit TsaD [Candidatus Omnitrophica bacterium]|nr:tRNA (adenosine(37)-N6)-threonylcarbamoyltransferase complex transferase subunit TsaD [Candidatus Omnitrophota bacterium]MBU1127525.1 tRNA (adenosine(37)-N6)-threonylcarbamoyltransferase complex transferase subunit TsaD [Candidatus Omnitrophota bacterium]MBU1657217.1 tRNA (adenosine(37)-N6)-threonylcarbamoyltransferase complex transferase subunit TsaD [Candidatus Omnitrophota bacterium]MBU1783817.1 tRNA (adenosine(37)-N6)-threonylcarbamoyltransferase complex transferase subunit TsaD [Candidat
MITLGIETSCDETAVSLVEDGRVLSSEISSSVHLHFEYGGVVPEIASRFHVEYIFSVLKKALQDARRDIKDVGLVAVTNRPGLPGSLLVGVSFAKAISLALGVPIIGVDHLKAHVISAFLGDVNSKTAEESFPFLGMVISGGHTNIYYCRNIKDFDLIGRTRDDAAGEAFDKVAKILGLGYPGGPVVEDRAGNYRQNEEIGFPRAVCGDKDHVDFSFSGLKTAVLYYWRDAAKTEAEKDRVCFSFQQAVIDVIDKNIYHAIKITGADRFAVGGGVINNNVLRERIMERCREEGVELYLPEKRYCADNAAMSAVMGEMLYRAGERSSLYLNTQRRVG